MKLSIKENSIQVIELKNTLIDEFSNKYKVSATIPSIVVIAKTKIIGVKVISKKNSLLIVGGFQNTLLQLVFTILFIILGIVIPLLLYFIFLHKKMKAFENEVATFIKQNYSAAVIN